MPRTGDTLSSHYIGRSIEAMTAVMNPTTSPLYCRCAPEGHHSTPRSATDAVLEALSEQNRAVHAVLPGAGGSP